MTFAFEGGGVGQMFGGDPGCGFFGFEAELLRPGAELGSGDGSGSAEDLGQGGMVGTEELRKGAQRVAGIRLAADLQFAGQLVAEPLHSVIVGAGWAGGQQFLVEMWGNGMPRMRCIRLLRALVEFVQVMLRRRGRIVGIAVLAAFHAVAAEESVLKYAGEALKLPYACAETELQSVGLLCTEDEPCSIMLEITSVATLGRKIFLAGNLHATSGTITSTLLSSEDGGATWKEPAKRIPMSGLNQMQFYDLDHGWVSGESQYPLPHDPFFLLTSDGGATWRTRALTEDGGPGVIARYWFDSAKHGEMVLDAGKSSPSGRYIAYESETGGESWMIRSTSDQMPRTARAASAGESEFVRVQADAKGKAYNIQKRNGDKWETVAAFSFEVASCRIKAPEFKDEPLSDAAEPVDDTQGKDYVKELKLGGPATSKPGSKPAPPKVNPKVKK